MQQVTRVTYQRRASTIPSVISVVSLSSANYTNDSSERVDSESVVTEKSSESEQYLFFYVDYCNNLTW